MLDFISGLVIEGYLPVFSALVGFLPIIVLILVIVSLFDGGAIPLSFACTTLGVNNANNDKKLIRFLSFIPCSAKLPSLLFIMTIILGWNSLAIIGMYAVSILLGYILSGYKIRRPSFVHINVRNLVGNVIRKVVEYISKVTIGLVLAVFVIYTLEYISILEPLIDTLKPLFIPIGLDNTALITSLIFGLVGKEMIVGVLLLYGVSAASFTLASALSFLVFVLLYTPCCPCLIAVRSKTGLKHMLSVAFYNFFVAYIASFVVYIVAVIITML